MNRSGNDCSTAIARRTLHPWFRSGNRLHISTQCFCDCAWTKILGALQEAGPVALVLPGSVTAVQAPSVLAAGLALGRGWTLRAAVTSDGVDESLHWDGAGYALEVHALPSSNWRPFDRLARQHHRAHGQPSRARPRAAVAMPLLVDEEFQLRVLRWSNLTRLDQEQGHHWMLRQGLRALQA